MAARPPTAVQPLPGAKHASAPPHLPANCAVEAASCQFQSAVPASSRVSIGHTNVAAAAVGTEGGRGRAVTPLALRCRDKERGVVWEECIILMPKQARFVFLSATIPNAREFADWIAKIHGCAVPSLYAASCIMHVVHSSRCV